jgi:hypothetical protein
MSRFIRFAALPLALFLAAPAVAGELFDTFDHDDRLHAQRRNVQAVHSNVVNIAPAGMVMTSIGRVSRGRGCLARADCNLPAVAAGNYLHATTRAPWIVYMLNIGTIERRGTIHDAGEMTAHNVIDIPARAIRPGGMIVRAFGAGRLVQDLRK